MSSKQFKAMSGHLQIKANHKWTDYEFKTSGVYFHYFNSAKAGKKPLGQLFKAEVKEVKPSLKQHKGAEYCFEVHHSGSGSPWVLSAATREDCIRWMECLQPGSSQSLKAPPLSPHPPSPHSPGYQQAQSPYNAYQQPQYNGQQPAPYNGQYNAQQHTPYNAHQQLPSNGYQQSCFHESMNAGMNSPHFMNSHNREDLMQTWHGSSKPTSPDQHSLSTPVEMTREGFFRQAQQSGTARSRSLHNSHSGAAPTQNLHSPHSGAVQNDYVSVGYGSKPIEQPNEPEEPDEDDRYIANIHARSLSYKNPASPNHKMQQQELDYQQQQRQQQHQQQQQSKPKVKPRTTVPVTDSPANTPEIYEYMSSKGVPLPAEDNNVYDDPQESLPRLSSPVSIPPRPPIRPRHTLRSIGSDEGNVAGDSCDGKSDPRNFSMSPSYVDPKELNTTFSRGQSQDSPTPPKPRKRLSSDKSYTDFLRYFSPEQMRQLTDMFKEVVGVEDGPQQMKKMFSSSDLISVLKETSQNIPDQILNQQDEYAIGDDESSRRWARANSRPHGKPLDKLAEEVQDINDPIYQMQRDAFTIHKEALFDFKVIGKGQYGVVEAALYRPSPGNAPIKVAIKKTKETCSQLEKDNFYKEIIVMAQFMHPNIVRVYGSVDKGVSSPWLVLEFLSNGDLKTFLKHNNRPVHRLVKYMVDIAMGMHYLSEKGFVHRDLAARNIFMDENELCKVGDFGLLRETTTYDDEDEEKHYVMRSELALPVRWMAVECLTKQIFSSASDVWSFGVLMWELFNPQVRPYRKMDNMTVIAAVSAGQRLDIPEKCPQTVGQVMQACWNADSAKRPSFLVIANLLCRCIQQETPSRTT